MAILAYFGLGTVRLRSADDPAFEVVSIRPIDMHYPSVLGPTNFRMQASVKFLVGFAYSLEDYAISGGPSWASSNAYDIQATTVAPASLPELRAMVATMLKQRFGLRMHFETRPTDVFLLTVGDKPLEIPKSAPGTPRDGRGAIQMDRTYIAHRGVSMTLFARSLSAHLGRPVLDRTGLEDIYTFDMNFDPADKPGSIRFAIGDLGLKIAAAKEPLSVAVIDSVDYPTEN